MTAAAGPATARKCGAGHGILCLPEAGAAHCTPRFLSMEHLLYILIAPVLLSALSAIFLFAGLEKLRDRERFYHVLLQLPLVPSAKAWQLSRIVPVLEVGLSVAAMVLRWRWAVVGLALLCFCFVAVVERLLARGSLIAIGCYGSDSGEPVAPGDLAKNLLLGGLLLALAPATAGPLGLAAHGLSVLLGVSATALFMAWKRWRHSRMTHRNADEES